MVLKNICCRLTFTFLGPLTAKNHFNKTKHLLQKPNREKNKKDDQNDDDKRMMNDQENRAQNRYILSNAGNGI